MMQPVNAHMAAIAEEYKHACSNFPPISSPREGISIIREEYLELERAIYQYGADACSCQQEATQLAAMCLRYLVDVIGDRSNEDDVPW